MKRVYIAGPYSADNVITIMANIRRGMRLATIVFKAGFAPFCPHLDFHYSLMVREGEDFTVQDYYDYSMAWLDVSDAVLLLPGWRFSKGTMAEIDRAWDLGIPVFGHFNALVAWDKDPYCLADGIRPSHNPDNLTDLQKMEEICCGTKVVTKTPRHLCPSCEMVMAKVPDGFERDGGEREFCPRCDFDLREVRK